MYYENNFINKFQRADYHTQLLTVFSITDIFFFTIKTIFFGLKNYYILHLFTSSILLFISLVQIIYFDKDYFKEVFYYKVKKFKNDFLINKTLFSLDNNYNTSMACIFFLVLSFNTSMLILLTWKCTILKQIMFAVSFILAVSSYIKIYFDKRALINKEILLEESKKVKVEVGIIDEKTGLWVSIEPEDIYNKDQHPFHILPTSAWPFFTAFFTFDMLFFTVHYLHYGLTPNTRHHLVFSIFFLIFTLFNWFTNIVQEAQAGDHTKKVRWNLLHGMMLFILSEVMLFFAIFWAFFHSSLAPTVAIYCVWPPLGIEPIYAFGLPLFNTVLLLSSGVSLTFSHRAVLEKQYQKGSLGLVITLVYGMFFTLVQLFEYVYAPFSINDGIYGSVFYFSTGFHGLHVIIGSIMLLVCLFRNGLNQFSSTQHVGFTCSIWYWHFVDVVWIFLFITIYWWGS